MEDKNAPLSLDDAPSLNGPEFSVERRNALQTTLQNTLRASEICVSEEAKDWGADSEGMLKYRHLFDLKFAEEQTPFSSEFVGFQMILHRYYGASKNEDNAIETAHVSTTLLNNELDLHTVLFSRDQESWFVSDPERVEDLKNEIVENKRDLSYEFEVEIRKVPSNESGLVDETEICLKNISRDGKKLGVEVVVNLGLADSFDASLHDATLLDSSVVDLDDPDPEDGMIEVEMSKGIFVEVVNPESRDGLFSAGDSETSAKLVAGMELSLYVLELITAQADLSLKEQSVDDILELKDVDPEWLDDAFISSK